MPRYKVTQKGFYGGSLYEPNGKRGVLHREEPFEMVQDPDNPKKKIERVPSWLERLPEESAAAKKKRLAAEAKAKAEAEEKAKADKAEIENASFLAEGGDNTETL